MVSPFKSILKEVINSDSKPSAQAKESESNNDFNKLLFDLYCVMKGVKSMDWNRIKWQYEQGFLTESQVESLKEREKVCKKRKHKCDGCSYKADCLHDIYKSLMIDLGEW